MIGWAVLLNRRDAWSVMTAAICAVCACGSAVSSADHPLTIGLGLARSDADRALSRHQYCHRVDGPRTAEETYPRCDRAGVEWGDSWVVARYDNDRLIELRRFERYSDDERAVERWNHLLGRYRAMGYTPLPQTGNLEPKTRSVQAFRTPEGAIAAVYLLEPVPPDRANVLEVIRRPDR